MTVRGSAETGKPLTVRRRRPRSPRGSAPSGSEVVLALADGHPLVDVVNNVGGIVLRNGYGADRGFQEVDEGQYDEPVEVFTGCGNGIALRTAAGREVGWFDDDFFLYYEDTDLSWRLRSQGWSIRYEPTARAAARALRRAARSGRRVGSSTSTATGCSCWSRTRPPGSRCAWCGATRCSAASMALRAVREALRQRTRPAVRPHLLRVRVMLSFLRLLGPMLARRRATARSATVSRAGAGALAGGAPMSGRGARPRAAVYDRFWHSMGGGERHGGMIAAGAVAGRRRRRPARAQRRGRPGRARRAPRPRPRRCTHADRPGPRRRRPGRPQRRVRPVRQRDLHVAADAAGPPHSAYLCFFPTPFDHDLAPWRRAVAQGRRAAAAPRGRATSALGLRHRLVPRRGRTAAALGLDQRHGVLSLVPGPDRDAAGRLRPGRACRRSTAVSITDEDGAVIDTLRRSPRRSSGSGSRSPPPRPASSCTSRRTTFVPGGDDRRTLGVAVSRLRLLGAANVGARAVAARFPWLLRDAPTGRSSSRTTWCWPTPTFTQDWIARSLGGRRGDPLPADRRGDDGAARPSGPRRSCRSAGSSRPGSATRSGSWRWCRRSAR